MRNRLQPSAAAPALKLRSAQAAEAGPFDELAADLLRAKVDVIVVTGNTVIAAARTAARQTPIVMCPSLDPVGAGFVSSLRRPGGYLTGINLQFDETTGKRLKRLREMRPKLVRVAFFSYDGPGVKAQLAAAQQAAEKLGLKLQVVELSAADALPRAFDEAVKGRAEALFFPSGGFNSGLRVQIAALALQHRLPSMLPLPAGADAGCLMAYGPNDREFFRQAAVFVDKLLKGTKPGDLPVEQPTRWELVINLKTAKALGIRVPQTLLPQAERVIE